MTRVTTEDLAWAATWLGAYEGDDGVPADAAGETDDEHVRTAQRVAEWLRAEVARRTEDAAVRDLVRRTGASPGHVRQALRRSVASADGQCA
jgi:hypothetical protein